MKDLRTFLACVRKERPSDLVEIDREISPRHETCAILTKLEQKQRSPVLIFRNVRGTRFPVVTNVCGSQGRLALALECPLKLIGERYAHGVDRPRKPVLWSGLAPVHENVLRGAQVDLSLLPAMVYHAGDSERPYITAAIVGARDPHTRKMNLSYHRLMIAQRNETGIFIERGKHLDRIFKKYAHDGKLMPIVVFIGVHPAWSLGALYSGSEEVEEYDIIGGLLDTPLSVTPAITQADLLVPSHAELVLEGTVDPSRLIDEGPFGEFTGFGTGMIKTPVFHVAAMTFRQDCLFQDIVSGHLEHLMLPMPALERRILADARAVCSGVQRIALIAPLTTVVALDKQDDAGPRQIIMALLTSDIYAKHVIVVDATVDPQDGRQILAAMALATQATEDVYILADALGTPLDPSCPREDGHTAKMGIDATRRLKSHRPVTINSVPQALLDSINLDEILKRK